MAFVKSVENYTLTLPAGTALASTSITPQTSADCIPFFSYRCTTGIGSGNATDQICPDVYFDVSNNVVAETGSGSTRALVVEISVVEFDTTKVDVQQGPWSVATSGVIDQVTLGSSVTAENTFAVFSYTLDAATTDLREANFRCFLSAQTGTATQIEFERHDSAGPAVSGHYFTAEALSGEFDVQAFTVVHETSTGDTTNTDPDWNRDETAYFSSFSGLSSSNDLRENSIYFNTSGDPITAVAYGVSIAGNEGFDASIFLVHFTGNEQVETEHTNADNSTTNTRTLGTDFGDQDICTIHTPTQPFLIQGYNNLAAGDRDDALHGWEWEGLSTAIVRWRRLAGITATFYPPAQIIAWDVVAGAPATRRVMVTS